MRLAGRIAGWNDAKGYGFIEPIGGGARAFVHVSQFGGGRRPKDGDRVSYAPTVDDRGRGGASDVRFDGAVDPRRGGAPRGEGSRLPRAALGLGALAAIVAAHLLGALPIEVAAAYTGLSVLAWAMYGWDKRAAEHGLRRTPESTLHVVALFGGWPGALVAQQQFRHKTVKQPFQGIFWMTAAANVAAVAWLSPTFIAA